MKYTLFKKDSDEQFKKKKRLLVSLSFLLAFILVVTIVIPGYFASRTITAVHSSIQTFAAAKTPEAKKGAALKFLQSVNHVQKLKSQEAEASLSLVGGNDSSQCYQLKTTITMFQDGIIDNWAGFLDSFRANPNASLGSVENELIGGAMGPGSFSYDANLVEGTGQIIATITDLTDDSTSQVEINRQTFIDLNSELQEIYDDNCAKGSRGGFWGDYWQSEIIID